MSEILQVIMNLSLLVFVITSMLVMGLTLTLQQIIAPLRDVRLVILALVANFVLVPILAYLILAFINLEQGLVAGLVGLVLLMVISGELGRRKISTTASEM